MRRKFSSSPFFFDSLSGYEEQVPRFSVVFCSYCLSKVSNQFMMRRTQGLSGYQIHLDIAIRSSRNKMEDYVLKACGTQ